MQQYAAVADAGVGTSIMSNAYDIALPLIANGTPVEEAARKAAEHAYNHRPSFIHPVNGKPLRVPKHLDAEIIEYGANSILQRIDMDRVDFAVLPGMSADMTKEQLRDAIATGGAAITSADEDGVELTFMGRTVYGKDKKPLVWTWDEVARLGKTLKAEYEDVQKTAGGMGMPATGMW